MITVYCIQGVGFAYDNYLEYLPYQNRVKLRISLCRGVLVNKELV
jgi:hypothetical protein